MSGPVKHLESFIFASRWIQAPLYLGLIVAQVVYCWLFMVELSHLVAGAFGPHHMTETDVMLIVLGLIDVVMIANLLIMVIVGGYETFVSRLDLEGHPDQPEWLSHVNAGVLKIKLSTAIIGISSIHLLKSFIEAGQLGLPLCTVDLLAAKALCTKATAQGVMWQTIIHIVFILSAIGIAWTDKLMTGNASKREHAGH